MKKYFTTLLLLVAAFSFSQTNQTFNNLDVRGTSKLRGITYPFGAVATSPINAAVHEVAMVNNTTFALCRMDFQEFADSIYNHITIPAQYWTKINDTIKTDYHVRLDRSLTMNYHTYQLGIVSGVMLDTGVVLRRLNGTHDDFISVGNFTGTVGGGWPITIASGGYNDAYSQILMGAGVIDMNSVNDDSNCDSQISMDTNTIYIQTSSRYNFDSEIYLDTSSVSLNTYIDDHVSPVGQVMLKDSTLTINTDSTIINGNLTVTGSITVGSDTTVTPILGRIVFMEADSSFYGCRSIIAPKKWYKLND